jgi:hypothetical protein
MVVEQELLKSCEKLELLDCSFCEQLKPNIRQLRHSAFLHSTQRFPFCLASSQKDFSASLIS